MQRAGAESGAPDKRYCDLDCASVSGWPIIRTNYQNTPCIRARTDWPGMAVSGSAMGKKELSLRLPLSSIQQLQDDIIDTPRFKVAT
jgi:hypothetical protein